MTTRWMLRWKTSFLVPSAPFSYTVKPFSAKKFGKISLGLRQFLWQVYILRRWLDTAVVNTRLILFWKYLARFWHHKIHGFLCRHFIDFKLYWRHFIEKRNTNCYVQFIRLSWKFFLQNMYNVKQPHLFCQSLEYFGLSYIFSVKAGVYVLKLVSIASKR